MRGLYIFKEFTIPYLNAQSKEKIPIQKLKNKTRITLRLRINFNSRIWATSPHYSGIQLKRHNHAHTSRINILLYIISDCFPCSCSRLFKYMKFIVLSYKPTMYGRCFYQLVGWFCLVTNNIFKLVCFFTITIYPSNIILLFS